MEKKKKQKSPTQNKLKQLKAENYKLKNNASCLWCGGVLAKYDSPLGFRVQWIRHLLDCKNHPLLKVIEELFTKNKQLLKQIKTLKEKKKK